MVIVDGDLRLGIYGAGAVRTRLGIHEAEGDSLIRSSTSPPGRAHRKGDAATSDSSTSP